MKELNKALNPYQKENIEQVLMNNFLETKEHQSFQQLVKEIPLSNEILCRYTSMLEESAEEFDHCKHCKGLIECKNKVNGYAYLPHVKKDHLEFEYQACKYQLKNKEERAEALDLALESINEKHGANTVIALSEIAPQKAKHPEGSDPTGEQNSCAGTANSNISIAEEKNMSIENLENSFIVLYRVDVSEYTEDKNSLTYLSWSNAWKEVKKLYPKAMYKVQKFGENRFPYICDPVTGYMVFTEVTIEDLTYEMWLPVLDNFNKALKNAPYKIGNREIPAATMFDINKAIMRCLAKNLAMFGLGLYIYAGEDLPEQIGETSGSDKKTENKKAEVKTVESLKIEIKQYCTKTKKSEAEVKDRIFAKYKVKNLWQLTEIQANDAIKLCRNFKK